MGFLTDNFLSRFFVDVINLFHGFTGDYVLAMLLFVLLVKVLLLPLDVKSKRSTLKTQMVQPKINAIRERYKNDPQKQSIALRELYKKEDIKMTAGCLPMLLQLPILFAMFGAIRILSNTQSIELVVGFANGQSVLPPSFLWIRNIWQPDTGHSPVMPSLAEFSTAVSTVGKMDPTILQSAQDVLHYSAVNQFAGATSGLTDTTLLGNLFSTAYQTIPTDLVQTASALNYQTVITPVLEAHAGFNNGYYVLPLLTFVTQWILTRMQTKQQAMTTGSVSGSNFMMELLMPLMIAWFAMTTGALFALYWTVGNLWSLGQSLVLNKVLTKSLNEAAAPAKK